LLIFHICIITRFHFASLCLTIRSKSFLFCKSCQFNGPLNSNNLTTSETSIFSTTPFESSQSGPSPTNSGNSNAYGANPGPAPISKPKRSQSPQQAAASEGEIADCETSSTASGKSFESNSKTSCLSHEKCSSPSALKEELKRLKFFELSLKEQIKDLSLQRDGLVMELQQLQEARPVLEKAYAVSHRLC